MKLPIFALLQRAIREGNTTVASYGWRVLVFIGMVLTITIAASRSFSFGAHGLQLFSFVAFMNCFVLSLVGVSVVATSIAQEKQEGTLTLLRMTRLGPMNILLGKSFGVFFMVFQFLLLQLPLVLLCIPLGGIGANQIFHTFVALGVYLVFLTGVGVLLSTLCRTPRVASFIFVVLIVALFFVGPLLSSIFAVNFGSTGAQWLSAFLNSISPFDRVARILSLGYSGSWLGPLFFWHVGIGLFCFGLAWLVFERAPHNAEAATKRLTGKKIKIARRYGSLPIVWKDFHTFSGGKRGALIRTVAYLTITGLFFSSANSNFIRNSDELFIGILFGVTLTGGSIELLVSLSRVFAKEIRERTLSGLALTPLPVRTIAYHKVGGVLLGLVPTLCLIIACMIFNPEIPEEIVRESAREPLSFFAPLSFGLFFTHLVVFYSLVLKRGPLAAAIGTVALLGTMLMVIATGSHVDFEAFAWFITIIGFAVAVVLHGASLNRLEALVQDV